MILYRVSTHENAFLKNKFTIDNIKLLILNYENNVFEIENLYCMLKCTTITITNNQIKVKFRFLDYILFDNII